MVYRFLTCSYWCNLAGHVIFGQSYRSWIKFSMYPSDPYIFPSIPSLYRLTARLTTVYSFSVESVSWFWVGRKEIINWRGLELGGTVTQHCCRENSDTVTKLTRGQWSRKKKTNKIEVVVKINRKHENNLSCKKCC